MSRVFAILAGLFLVDRIIKFAVSDFLPPEGVTLLGGVMHLEAFPNRALLGTVEFPAALANAIVATILLVLTVPFVQAIRARRALSALGFGLILAGAASNLLDRLTTGAVLDYVFINPSFPVFNMSDITILGGIVTVLQLRLRGAMGKEVK